MKGIVYEYVKKTWGEMATNGNANYSKKYDDLKLLAFAKRYEKIFNFSKIKPKLSN